MRSKKYLQRVLLLNIARIVNLYIILKLLRKRKIRRYWHKPHLHPLMREKYSAVNHLFLYFALHDHDEFENFIHMNVDTFISLNNLTQARLTKYSIRQPLDPDVRLIIVLHFLSHGTCIQTEHWLFYVGLSTVYAILPEVCQVLSDILIPRFVQFPNKQKWLQIAQGFEEKCNFPNCIGALDGTEIEIQKPPHAGAQFENYKKYNSMTLMATCDADYKITWFNFGDYGSNSDSSVFLQTDLFTRLRRNEANIPSPRILPNSIEQTPFVFVADEIFGLSNHIMKPYPRRNHLSMEEEIYNYRLSRARLMIECTFGIINEKFQVFQKRLAFSLKHIELIVSAAIGIHNFRLSQTTYNDENHINENYLTYPEVQNAAFPGIVRERLKNYFNTPAGLVAWQYNIFD